MLLKRCGRIGYRKFDAFAFRCYNGSTIINGCSIWVDAAWMIAKYYLNFILNDDNQYIFVLVMIDLIDESDAYL